MKYSNTMNKILFILKLPPPVHGSTMMNKIVQNSELLKNSFETTILESSISTDTKDIGKWSLRKAILIFKNYFNLYQALRKDKPELVYFALSPISFAFIKDFISIIIIKFFDIPIVYHLHGKGISTYSKKWLFNILYKRAFTNQFAVVLADELRSDIERYHFSGIYTVPNGIKADVDRSVFENTNLKSQVFTLLYLSNFVKSKGLIEFLSACSILKRKSLDFNINIIGKPIDIKQEEVKNYVVANNLESNLNFLGPAYDQQKINLMLSSDILVFPTFYANECLPLVLIEAMQCGLPIITSREGGIPSIIRDKKNGLLIDPRSPQEIANSIEELYFHPEIRLKMRLQARSDYENFYTIGVFEENLADVLNKVIRKIHENHS